MKISTRKITWMTVSFCFALLTGAPPVGNVPARNDMNYEFAFQAAETGLETMMSAGTFPTGGAADVTIIISAYGNAQDSVLTQLDYEDTSIVPDKAFSLGTGGVSAYHFIGTATSQSLRDTGGPTDRDAGAVHTQAFYIVGPGAQTL